MSDFLILSKRLSFDGESPWLTDDLVLSLLEHKENVDVLLFDLSGKWKAGRSRWNGANVYAFPVSYSRGVIRYLSIVFNYLKILFFSFYLKRNKKYDFVVGFSISFFFLFVPKIMRRSCSSMNVLFLWDFFPFHHRQIGKINDGLSFGVAKMLEKASIYEYDHVALMSEKNKDVFFRLYPEYAGGASVVPVWGKGKTFIEVEKKDDFSEEFLNVVFGGQLTSGRGIEEIVILAKRLRAEGAKVRVHVFGDGSLSYLIKEEAEKNPHLYYWGSVGRSDYKSYLKSADVGLVVTVSGVTYPTFPSKVIDYFSCKKPVVASVEENTDFGAFVQDYVGAGVAVSAGDNERLYEAVVEFQELKVDGKLNAMGDNAYNYYVSHMEVSNTVLWLKELARKDI